MHTGKKKGEPKCISNCYDHVPKFIGSIMPNAPKDYGPDATGAGKTYDTPRGEGTIEIYYLDSLAYGTE